MINSALIFNLLISSQFGSGLKPFPNSENFTGSSPEELISNPSAAFSSGEIIVSRILGFATILAGILLIVYFLIGAFGWLTAGGDSGKIQKARDQMVNAVVGLIIVVAAFSVVGLIGAVVGLDILNLQANLEQVTAPIDQGQP
ncbi:MAG: hypothetical protein COU69_00660 [Candidatus Pacebacteria bacterium CG10_big_fil_rev_8_21_14_0_10_56_10]|nr:MAG: hypothetical protein COU69_00660 [Candidatus Pacebacteria bacterium CG10_big_fil_rev_8_21_14_0_10_56_10]